MMDKINQELIKELQGNIPFEENPYEELGKKLGISEDEVIERLQLMKDSNQLKRIGAVLRHQKSGYLYNAMVVFKTDEVITETVGMELSASHLSSHCYERKPYEIWPYNLYVMLHSRNKYEIETFIEAIVKKHEILDYQILHSVRELKKSSMTYFSKSN
ncbi:siroheme decarboxylase subunit beta [Proteocatella sphenisci]|uniref:siroheme decarboxylase subunit beta n=1 Tax=Proteocatella sphenisci TaxID=181070 RepID=UPI00049007C7|nr:AsnC family transcriptional regulator [Proteocatella sphenisci]